MENQDTNQFPPVPADSKDAVTDAFRGLYQKAMDLDTPADMLDSTPPATSEQPLPSKSDLEAKIKAQSESATTPEPQAEPTLDATASNDDSVVREFKDTDLVRVKVNGKEEVVSYKDYKDGIQREADYTRKMQTFARQRDEAEQALANQYAQLYQYAQAVAMAKQELESNSPLTKLAQRLEAEAKTEKDPNTLATVGEIQQALKEHSTRVQQEFIQRENAQRHQLANAAQHLRAEAAQAADANRFTAALTETLANKDLAVVKSVVPSPELADAIIRYNVAQMNPDSIDQGIDYMRTFVKGWADNIKSQQKQDVGRAEATKARAKIEPPAGSPPAPTQSSKPGSFFKKDGALDWQALNARALAMLEQ